MAKTVAFFPEGAYGPTNNCVGIADVLRQRGWRVVFIAERSFAGTLEEKGFEERLVDLTEPAEGADGGDDAGQFWKDFIRETAPVFRKPTIDQLGDFIVPTFQALVDGARYVDEQLVEIIDEVRPDVIVEDNVVSFPAIPAADAPWVRIVSCNPAEVKDPSVPPVFSGYAAADRSGSKLINRSSATKGSATARARSTMRSVSSGSSRTRAERSRRPSSNQSSHC